MKKITAMIAIVFMTLNAFAQKPVKGDMGMTFGFNGLSTLGVTTTTPTGTLLFKYYITDNLAARASLNFTSSSFSTDLIDTGATHYETSTKSSSWGIAIGAQKSCGTIKRIEPYIGLDLYVGSGVNGKIDDMTTDSSGNFSIHTVTTPGATFSWGVTPVVGFNWFFDDHFALGAEFGWGIGMSSTKSGETVETIHFGTNPDTVIKTNSTSSKSSSIGGNASGLITFSVFFD